MTEGKHNWGAFWGELSRDYGIKADEAHERANIASFKDYLAAHPDKTLDDIKGFILGQPAPDDEAAAVPAVPSPAAGLPSPIESAAAAPAPTQPLYEAPASANFRIRHPSGIDVQFTVRNHKLSTVMTRVEYVIKALTDKGWNRMAPPAVAPAGPPSGPPQADPPQQPSQPQAPQGWCSIHGVQMKYREKDGQGWWSHKAGDIWCRGQAQ